MMMTTTTAAVMIMPLILLMQALTQIMDPPTTLTMMTPQECITLHPQTQETKSFQWSNHIQQNIHMSEMQEWTQEWTQTRPKLQECTRVWTLQEWTRTGTPT